MASKTYGDAPFSLSATASSGLPVTYLSSDTDVTSINGDIVTILAAGNAVITASQEGNGFYNAALNTKQTLIVEPPSSQLTLLHKTSVNSMDSETGGEGPLNIKILGNPFDENLNFIVESAQAKDSDIRLTNLNEKVIHQSRQLTNAVIQIRRDFLQGVYILKATSGNEQKIVRVMACD